MTKKELKNYIKLKKRLLKDINKIMLYLNSDDLDEDELKADEINSSDILEFEHEHDVDVRVNSAGPALYDVLNFFQACNDWWGEDIENAEELLKKKDVK
jgi:hypothetical protein